MTPNDRSASSLLWTMPEELLQMARESGANFITELFAIFLEDSGARLRELRKAIRNADTNAIRDQAHSLKGSAAQVGASGLAALCQRMERLAQSGTASDQAALCEAIERTFLQITERLTGSDLHKILAQKGILQ